MLYLIQYFTSCYRIFSNLMSSHLPICLVCLPSDTHTKKRRCTKSLLELTNCRGRHNDTFSAPNTSGKSIKSSWIPCQNFARLRRGKLFEYDEIQKKSINQC